MIQPAVTSFYTDVIVGRKNLSEDWDAYVRELNAMGLKRYMELVNIYIDLGNEQ